MRARPVRGALRHRRALSAGAGGAGRAVPQATRTLPALLRTVAPTWLLQLPWLSTAEERDALRRELAGVGPDRMLREMGELLDRYTEQRPLLLVTEDLHWSDRATIQLIDHVARRRGRAAPDVAGDLPRGRGGRDGPSAQPVAARAAPAPAVRGDRARPVLRDRGRRLHRAAFAVARARRGLRACAARAHRRRAAVRLVGHHRGDGAHRRRRGGGGAARGGGGAREPGGHHRPLHRPARQRAARAARGGRGLRGRVPGRHAGAGPGARHRLGGPGLRRAGARARVARGAACRRRTAMRLELPYSFRHALFRQVLYDRTPPSARMQLHREVGAALERRARGRRGGRRRRSWRCTSTAGGSRWPRCATTPRRPKPRCCTSAPRPASAWPSARWPWCRRRRRGPSATRWSSRSRRCTACRPSTRSASAREAMNAFERAYALLAGAPEHPMRGRLLHGFGYVSSLRGEYVRGAGGREARRSARGRVGRSGADAGRVLPARRGPSSAGPHAGGPLVDGARARDRRDARPCGERGLRGRPASHLARDAGHRPRALRPGAAGPGAGAAGACARAPSCGSR